MSLNLFKARTKIIATFILAIGTIVIIYGLADEVERRSTLTSYEVKK